ncbi:CRISPR-associated endonuclease Cas2 [Paraburkholderia hayleyella]|uniref:CRISPR-associated endonuclease Cas2 n=1 Tax=Paraburkholderia hayleyella TaxID=2152889 RepID=UPI0012918E80|nr:CRISPR-associated endonuclease Cas2 [Paraburkholderia hayleyella]
MSQITRRYMRLLVFFDLPVTTREKRRTYTIFRRFLIQDGYDMIQWSVYGRMVNGFDDAEKHMKRLANNLPKEGSIRCLQVSEKQFANMKLLVGLQSFQEKKVNANQMLLF